MNNELPIDKSRGVRLVIWGLFLTFGGWTLGVALPILYPKLYIIVLSLGFFVIALLFSFILIFLAINNQENIVVASIYLFLFGVLEGLISSFIVLLAIAFVPLQILLATFGILALFFLIELIIAYKVDIEEYPSKLILAMLIFIFGLAIIQLFVEFFSLMSLIIDIIIIIVFAIILFFDLEYFKNEPEKWVYHTLHIFLDIVNIIIRVLIILIRAYSENK